MYNLNGYIQALKDEETGVRAPAALALGQIGKPAVAEFHISQPTHGKGLSPRAYHHTKKFESLQPNPTE